MDKPEQYELDVCRDVIEAYIAALRKHEPGAFNTIEYFEGTLAALPECEEEWPHG